MHHIKDAFEHLKHKNGQQPLHQPAQPGAGYPGSQVQQPTQPHQPQPTAHHQSPLSGTTQGAIDVFMASKQPNGEIGGIGYWQTANVGELS